MKGSDWKEIERASLRDEEDSSILGFDVSRVFKKPLASVLKKKHPLAAFAPPPAATHPSAVDPIYTPRKANRSLAKMSSPMNGQHYTPTSSPPRPTRAAGAAAAQVPAKGVAALDDESPPSQEAEPVESDILPPEEEDAAAYPHSYEEHEPPKMHAAADAGDAPVHDEGEPSQPAAGGQQRRVGVTEKVLEGVAAMGDEGGTTDQIYEYVRKSFPDLQKQRISQALAAVLAQNRVHRPKYGVYKIGKTPPRRGASWTKKMEEQPAAAPAQPSSASHVVVAAAPESAARPAPDVHTLSDSEEGIVITEEDEAVLTPADRTFLAAQFMSMKTGLIKMRKGEMAKKERLRRVLVDMGIAE